MPPADFVHPRIGLDVALEVDVGALPYGRCGVQIAAQLQRDDGHVWWSGMVSGGGIKYIWLLCMGHTLVNTKLSANEVLVPRAMCCVPVTYN